MINLDMLAYGETVDIVQWRGKNPHVFKARLYKGPLKDEDGETYITYFLETEDKAWPGYSNEPDGAFYHQAYLDDEGKRWIDGEY